MRRKEKDNVTALLSAVAAADDDQEENAMDDFSLSNNDLTM